MMAKNHTETIFDKLMQRLQPKTTVVGVGNELRGDDAAGSIIARKLINNLENASAHETIDVIDCSDVPENYIGPILETAPHQVVFLDAVDFGGQPGEIRTVAINELAEETVSTHNSSLSVLARVLRAEGIEHQLVIGIQPKHTSFGTSCSKEVLAAIDRLTEAFTRYVNIMPHTHE